MAGDCPRIVRRRHDVVPGVRACRAGAAGVHQRARARRPDLRSRRAVNVREGRETDLRYSGHPPHWMRDRFKNQSVAIATAPTTAREREDARTLGGGQGQGGGQGGGGAAGAGAPAIPLKWLSASADKIYFTRLSHDMKKSTSASRTRARATSGRS
jgi:hypothetical protein